MSRIYVFLIFLIFLFTSSACIFDTNSEQKTTTELNTVTISSDDWVKESHITTQEITNTSEGDNFPVTAINDIITDEASSETDEYTYETEEMNNHFHFDLVIYDENILEVNLLVGGFVNLCGFDIEVNYNPDHIRLSSYQQVLTHMYSNIEMDDTVRLNYVNSNMNLSDLTLVSTFTFEVISASGINIKIDIIDVIKLEQNGLDITEVESTSTNFEYIE